MFKTRMLLCRVLLFATLCYQPAQADIIITTANGDVQGMMESGGGTNVYSFKGIPYAKAPVRGLRFKKSEAVENWSPAVIDGTALPPACIQTSELPWVGNTPFLQPPSQFSEDCLYLNIWSPLNFTDMSVLVFFHGGGFYSGSATYDLFDGYTLSRRKREVVVTVNYRLGPLGFAYLGPDTIPGNMGLWDQLLALQWIYTNVATFGGNPNRIVLVGQEAGAAAVGFHMLNTASHPLFDKAIMLSGSPNTDWMYNEADLGVNNTKLLGEIVGCPAFTDDATLFDCLNGTDVQVLADSQFGFDYQGLPFVPVVDGDFLQDDPGAMIESGMIKNTDVMHGVVKDEASLTIMAEVMKLQNVTTPPASLTLTEEDYNTLLNVLVESLKTPIDADALSDYYIANHGSPVNYLEVLVELWSDINYKCPVINFDSRYSQDNPVYQLQLQYRPTVSEFPNWVGVRNGVDLVFVFGIPIDSSGYIVPDKSISRSYQAYFDDFARSGIPESSDIWQVYTEGGSYLIVDSTKSNGTGLRSEQCEFIQSLVNGTDTSTLEPKTSQSTGVSSTDYFTPIPSISTDYYTDSSSTDITTLEPSTSPSTDHSSTDQASTISQISTDYSTDISSTDITTIEPSTLSSTYPSTTDHHLTISQISIGHSTDSSSTDITTLEPSTSSSTDDSSTDKVSTISQIPTDHSTNSQSTESTTTNSPPVTVTSCTVSSTTDSGSDGLHVMGFYGNFIMFAVSSSVLINLLPVM